MVLERGSIRFDLIRFDLMFFHAGVRKQLLHFTLTFSVQEVVFMSGSQCPNNLQ